MKRNKKLYIIIMILMSIAIFSACTNEDNKVIEFYKVKYQLGSIKFNESNELFNEDINLITSVEEIANLGIENHDYTSDFFTKNTLIILKFIHPSTEKNIMLYELVNKEGKLYFIFKLDSPELNSDDMQYSFYSIELQNNTIENYSIGNILVINNICPELGSVHYDKFNGTII